MQSPQAKLKDIKRLLGVYPPLNTADAEQTVRNYLLAVDDYTAADVEAAVNTFIKGSAPGVNPSFLPPPPAVGAECRRQMNLRLDAEARERLARPKLPKPDYQRSPDEEARVKDGFDALIANLSSKVRTEDAEATARNKAVLDRTNQRFAPDMSDEAVHQRLGRRLSYSVGDRDGQEDAA